MSVLLELKNVTKKINNKTIVDNITFSIKKGEIFGFIGPNGAGKTTTIKMICGLYNITSGDIYINNKNISKNLEESLGCIGAIVENPEMYKYLSGRDNLKIISRMYNNIDKERIHEVIKLVKLENRIDDKVKTYSLGMKQRLGIAQSLLHKPKLLILDEPTNGLDPMGIKDLRKTLRHLADNENLCIVVSSHLLSEMELMCDTFCIINNGKIIDIKTLDNIKNKLNIKVKFSFKLDNIEKSKTLLEDNFKELDIDIDNNRLIVSCEKDMLSNINKLLINNNINLFEILPLSNTLEDEFLEMTADSNKQIR
ncbi:MAG: ABC transporter ATP-binding protein [Oscillospiraceae bacterium]|nr:ABC transporter ATP-binding protein [Oscillospiraceae bacterium]